MTDGYNNIIPLRVNETSSQVIYLGYGGYPGGTPVTNSRDTIVQLNASTQLTISFIGGLYSDAYYQTSFSGF